MDASLNDEKAFGVSKYIMKGRELIDIMDLVVELGCEFE
jgi:hypothetical protein